MATIRPLADENIPQAADLMAACYREIAVRDQYNDAELHGLLAQCETDYVRRQFAAFEVMVAEEDGQVAGFAAVEGNDIALLFVAPAHQNKGIGTQLLTAAEESLSAGGHTEVTATTATAPKFYTRRGYDIRGRSTCDEGPLKGRALLNLLKNLEVELTGEEEAVLRENTRPYWCIAYVEWPWDVMKEGMVLHVGLEHLAEKEEPPWRELDYAVLCRTRAITEAWAYRHVQGAIEGLDLKLVQPVENLPVSDLILTRHEKKEVAGLRPSGNISVHGVHIGFLKNNQAAREAAVQMIRKCISRRWWEIWK